MSSSASVHSNESCRRLIGDPESETRTTEKSIASSGGVETKQTTGTRTDVPMPMPSGFFRRAMYNLKHNQLDEVAKDPAPTMAVGRI